MTVRWSSATISELITSGAILGHQDGNHGSQYPRVNEFGTVGVPFLTAALIRDGYVDLESAPRLAESRAGSLRIGFTKTGDVLLSHNATIGRVAIVPEYAGRLLLGTSLTYFRLDPSKLLPRYFAAFLSGRDFQNQLRAVMSQSTRNQVPITSQRTLRVVVPPLPEQRAIAHILGTLDDKIELNRRMNETLEEMARALFKSWFVDFDPVHAKAAGKRPYGMDEATATLFPDSFEESGADQAPKGWSATTLGSLTLYLQRGFQPAYTTSDDGILVVNQKCVRNGRVDFSLARRHDTQKRTVEGRTLRELDVLVNSTGVGTLGRVAILAKSSPDATCDSHVTVLRPDTLKVDAYWFGCQLRFLQPLIETLGQGSTGQTELSRARLAALEVSTPGRALQDRFSFIVAPILERMWKAEAESVTLASIRDTLLPRLLSGELRVDNAEKTVAEAV